MIENGKYKGFDENIKSQLDESSKTLIGAPITTGLDTAYAINAPEINWAGYKLYDEDLTSTGHMLSYIETQLDSKAATSSGDVWDDIKDNEYITSQINIYASYTSNKIAPNIVWQNPIDNDTYSTLPSSSSSDAQGWYTSIDTIPGNNQYVWMSSIYIVKSLSNNILGYRGPSSTPIYLPSESGINGNFKSTVFCRTNEIPVAPERGADYNTGLPNNTNVYNNSDYNDNHIISNIEWSDGIPDGQAKLWASTGIIEDSSPDDTVWSTPRQMTDTATYDVEFAKKQTNDATPATPTDSNRHGGSGTQIWFDPANDASEDFTQMYWRAERECINGEWGDWIIVRIKGEQGTAGLRGAFKSTVFKRSETQPQTPGSSEGTYDNPKPSGWSDGIPNGTGPVWSTWKIFTASSDNGDWYPVQLVADTPTYDVEFSPNETKPNDPSTTPSVWIDPTTNHYKDHTEQNPHIYEGSWEAMIWRAERNRATTQDDWSNWVITKIKGEDGKVNASLPYHEQRWAYFGENIIPEAPDNNAYTVGDDDNATWKLTFQYESGKYTWMTTRSVIYDIEDNVQTAEYASGSSWSTPIRITPKDGINGEANPIQPVLKYTWYNHYDDGENYPAYLASEANPNQTSQGKTNVEWHESPGNPSGDNKYLWMIQGERFNGNMRLWDTDGDPNTNEAYWTSPVCLSGKDGEPGADGDDIEFIYKRFSSAHDFTNDNPSSWYTTGSIDKPIEEWRPREDDNHIYSYVNDYLGPDGSGWYDNPQGVDSSYKYEYATYRKTHKINGESYWGTFSTPFPWSIYGENGIDGDGVEYIYYTYNSSNVDPVPPIFDLDPNSFQKSEVYGEVTVDGNSYIWHDDPQTLDSVNQKFQWVSTRKYRAITLSNINKLPNTYTLDGGILKYNGNDTDYKVGDKIWFPYSDPELWNWYTENGTDAARIVMVYKRSSSNSSENAPTVNENVTRIIEGSYNASANTDGTSGWFESPGNNSSHSEDDDYLWMSSNYYSNVIYVNGKNGAPNTYHYTVTDEWTTPVCLTGEPGHDGEDGTDIEFIYFRTADDNNTPSLPQTDSNYQQNDWPFVGTQGTSYYIIDGVKTLSNQDNDTWTDNPLGVTSTYDYEYASIRKKIDGTWQDFCKPFLWSKYGEDGVDGDGVEYIYYLSSDEHEVTFNSTNNNLPPAFNLNPSSFQKPEVLGNNWSDDPTGISEDRRWEYVSVRKFREITDSNLNDIPESYREQVNVGDKIWFPYSEPAVWSHFAVDALATSLVFETDNDMIAVSVDDNSHVTKNATSTARMYLYHDTKLVSTSYYNVNILDSNLDEHDGEIKGYYDDGNVSYSYLKYNDDIIAKVSLSNNTYVMEYNIPQDFDMSHIDDELRITTSAYVFDNSFDNTGHVEVGSERPFVNKVKGLHVDLSDIYQIQTDKNVVKKDAHNELENVTITLKSLTSNSRIDTTSDAVNNHLFALYKDGININKNTRISYVVEIGTPITLNDKLSAHEFELWYNPSNTYWVNNKLSSPNNVSQIFNGENDILLDKESLSLVWDGTDGKPGTDSKSQEYIYYRSELPVSTWDNAHNPSVWNTHENVIVDRKSYYAYCTDDFPFIAERTSYNNWYDHPQGIDGESYLYEYVSTREYDTSIKEWGSFSEPVAWATWGHTGEDGDGVEYIFSYGTSANWKESLHYNIDSSSDKYVDPRRWIWADADLDDNIIMPENWDSAEFIPIQLNNTWFDNPKANLELGHYQFASIRKYKTLTQDVYNNLTADDLGCTQSENINSIKNILQSYIGEKIWFPYSEPSIWSSNIQGPTGGSGSSGLTFEFDNPTLQVAVNSNGIIKDNQTLLTYVHLYEGSTDKSDQITSVTIPDENNSLYHPFNTSYIYQGGLKFYKTITKDNNNTYYYQFVINDLDVNNNGEVDPGDYFPNNISYTLNSNLQMPFTIHYNGNEYTKYLTFTPIHYGEDGQDAELFELSSETSVIRYDAKSDNLDYEPSYVEYNIHHVRGNNDETQYINEIVSYTDINEYLNNGTLKLYYHLDTEGGIQQQEGGTIVVGDQTRPAPGTNSTTIFADTNTSLSGSGLYTTEGASLGGTKTDTTSTSHFVTDVNTIQADSVVVVPVREVELERNTAEETLLTYLDNSLNWSSMFNSYVGTNSQNTSSGSGSGSSGDLGEIIPIVDPTSKYDATNIASVAQALNDYADYLETAPEQETNVRASFNVADIRNTADIVSNVASSLGTITTGKDGSQSWALSNNEASIYVNDAIAQQDSEISTSIHSKVSAIEIQQKHDDLIQAQTIRDDLVQRGTESEYYDNYASPEYTRIASATIDETWKLLTMSGNNDITFKLDINNLIKNRQNWTPSSNGSTIINNNISGTVTLIRIRLVYDNSETLTVWDEDSLEIVYDGIDGVDSDVMEYIYYCPADTNQKSWNTTGGDNSENPANWTASNTPDYFPDGNTYIDNGSNGGWADHPHGVDSTHPYEYYSIRTKDGATGTWSQYETPVVWSHYGETGRDGDGIEYIFWRPTGTELKTWTDIVFNNENVEDPRTWSTTGTTEGKNGKIFQDNEYLGPTDSPWTDNPTGVTAGNSYEYVSQRKYNGTTKLWEMFSKPAVWTNYGQKGDKGDTGDSGATAYVLDWTNDQINLAVDNNGYVLAGQEKYTTLNITSLNGVFGDKPYYTIAWDTNIWLDGSNQDGGTIRNPHYPSYAFNKFHDGTGISSNTIGYSAISNNINTLYFKHAESTGTTDYAKSIMIKAGSNYATNKAYIPESGLDIELTINVNGNSKNVTQRKVLRVCGQHNGENAVTYELNPINTAITYTNNILNPSTLSTSILRYNGNEVTSLTYNNTTGFGNNLYVSYQLYPNTTSYPYTGSINLTKVNNGSSIALSNDISAIKFILRSETDNNSIVIDRENIPFIKSGEKGAQGFTGPIVRFAGEYNSSKHYSDGAIRTGESNSNFNYSETDGPRYIDIVIHENQYWKCKDHISFKTTTSNGITKNTGYINNQEPSSNSSYWGIATNFDFVATKLLYADQALINQISSHDFIATTQDGTPVAGMTSGKKDYGSGNTSLSLLNNANHGNVDTGGDNTDTLADTSHVRMFAGQIWKTENNTTSYSLTYAPFNVRQDGTAYMSKANIVGDVNIGGQVNIAGNVNIEGNAKVKADVSVNTLTLNSGSFIINSNCNLPNFNVNEHKMFYVLIHKQDNNVCYINPQNNQSILATDTNGNFKNYDPGTSIELQNHGLYTAISTYMNDMSYWVVSKTGVYAVPSSRQTYRKIFSKGYIDENPFIYISNIEIQDKKVIKCTFTTNGNSAPSSDKNGFDNVQSIFIYCSLNQNSYYQVGIRSNNHWIYNSLTPDEILPSRNDNDTSFNISHHYMSGSNSVNGWNNNTDIHVELVWNDPTEQESGYDGLSVDAYRILYYHNEHGWRHNISNVDTDAISGGNYYISNQPDKFNYYVEIVYYN